MKLIETSRLTIAPPMHFKMRGHWYLNDLQATYEDQDVKRYIGEPGREYTREDVAHIIEEENDNWEAGGLALMLLYDDAKDRVVGIVKLQPSPMEPDDLEVVIALHPRCRRRGYAREAMKGVLAYAASLGRSRVLGRVSPDNSQSRALIESLGFRRIGEREDPWTTEIHRGVEDVYELRFA